MYIIRNLDIQTGFKTRNILCQPVRRSKGSQLVAVIQMINKENNLDFGTEDEGVLSASAHRVADVFSERFKELQKCAERFMVSATYVSGKAYNANSPNPQAKPSRVSYSDPVAVDMI